MLTHGQLEALLTGGGFADAARTLTEHGYEDMSEMNSVEVEQALADARNRELQDLADVAAQKELVDVFRLPYDYHNAKTLVKTCGDIEKARALLSDAGRVPAEELIKGYQEEDADLPKILAGAMNEAKETLAATHNPQTSDIILDHAYFAELLALVEPLKNEFVSGYVRMLIDSANLRATVRTRRMGRDTAFLEEVLVSGGTVAVDSILEKVKAEESLAELFSSTVFAEAAILGETAIEGGALTQFEKAMDNATSTYLAGADFISFGIGPVLAYLAALENQTTALRMILTGWLRGVPAETIRERLRGNDA